MDCVPGLLPLVLLLSSCVMSGVSLILSLMGFCTSDLEVTLGSFAVHMGFHGAGMDLGGAAVYMGFLGAGMDLCGAAVCMGLRGEVIFGILNSVMSGLF